MTAGDNEGSLDGFYQALLESRVPFSLVDDRDLAPTVIDRYKTIVLPNIAALSDAQCGRIRDYVAHGGAIVATGETALYDELGNQRKNFGLADLFGCDFGGQVDRRVANSYLSIEGPHRLTAGLETPRIVGGTCVVHTTPRDAGVPAPIRLIRSYPDLPAEAAYPREPTSDVPMAYVRSFGKGRVVYFPFNLDAVFWDYGAKDHLILLRNAVAWATGSLQPLTVSGAGLIDVSYWRQDRSLAAHLVNLNNPSTMKGCIRESVPLGPLTVSLEVPTSANIAGVRLLEAGQQAGTRRTGNRLIIEVPRIRMHEVIAVDLV